MALRKLRAQVAQGHHARSRRGVVVRPDPAVDEHSASSLLAVDPVGDAGILVRHDHAKAAVGIDVHLLVAQARLAIGEVARLEPAERVRREAAWNRFL